MDAEGGDSAVAQTVQSHETIGAVGQTKAAAQPSVNFRIIEDVRGRVKTEIAEELLLRTEYQSAHRRVNTVCSNQEIGVGAGAVGERDADAARRIVDCSHTATEAEVNALGQFFAQRCLEIWSQNAEQSSSRANSV